MVQDGRFGAANIVGDVLVAPGLADLFLETLQLGVERHHDIVEALEVVLGGAQAQLGLVAARMQPGDAGRLFQQNAAVRGPGVDQRPDPALTDQCCGARPGRLVGKQDLHIARAHIAAVDLVVRAFLALDASRDLDVVGTVELGWRRAFLVVEAEDNFGRVASRTIRRAAENDVIHAAAAHLLGRGLAHDPAERLHEVGLAAPVGADNTGQAGRDIKIGPVDERFEACQSQLVELHRYVTPK